MRREVAGGKEPLGDHLYENGGVDIGALFADGHLFDNRFRSQHKADADARGEDLRETADIDDLARVVEGFD